MSRFLPAVTFVVATLCVGCGSGDGGGSAAADEPTVLESARATCAEQIQETLVKGDMDNEATPDDFLVLGDDGATVTVTQPRDGKIATMLSVLAGTCMLLETDAPDSVTAAVKQTTALMGRQEAEWGGIEMAYSYHPENGFSAVLTLSAKDSDD